MKKYVNVLWKNDFKYLVPYSFVCIVKFYLYKIQQILNPASEICSIIVLLLFQSKFV